jgi:hypothetical protein
MGLLWLHVAGLRLAIRLLWLLVGGLLLIHRLQVTYGL